MLTIRPGRRSANAPLWPPTLETFPIVKASKVEWGKRLSLCPMPAERISFCSLRGVRACRHTQTTGTQLQKRIETTRLARKEATELETTDEGHAKSM